MGKALHAEWITRRWIPLLAGAILVAIGMATTTWWGPQIAGRTHWPLPNDLRGTLVAADRLRRLDIGGLYTPPTTLVSFPGAALVLVPAVALLDALGLGLGLFGTHGAQPGWWVVAGPYEIALSSIALLAVDAIAERSGVSRPKRVLLAAAQAVALWNVSVRWGHPEDAVAVALLLYGVLALSDGRVSRSAWLLGAAVAVQPLVLLALPVLLVALEPRRVAGYLARAAVPAAVLLGAALATNWNAAVRAVSHQPNWPAIDHPTPWVALAPHLSHGAVAAGPARAVAILLACACAVVARHTWRTKRTRTVPALPEFLWWIAVALSLRCVFEPVMVAYYVWPVLAVALVSAAERWSRLAGAAVFSSAVTFLAQVSWPGRWYWWSMVVAGLLLVLVSARGRRSWRAPDGAALPPAPGPDGGAQPGGEVGLHAGTRGSPTSGRPIPAAPPRLPRLRRRPGGWCPGRRTGVRRTYFCRR